MSIKLLACDFDGTVADRDSNISPATIAALDAARAAGVCVVIATGRMAHTMEPHLDRLHVGNEPLITAQGAFVGYRDGRILRRKALAASLGRQAATIARPLGAHMAFYTDNEILIDDWAASPAQYETWFGGPIQRHTEISERLDGEIIKFMAIQMDEDRVPPLLAALQSALGEQAHISRSWRWFVEGSAPGADKGTALAWLCAYLGIERDEVLAIGDGGNDVSMLQWAGHSAAPADGDPAAIAAAQWQAPPLVDDPVPAALRHFDVLTGHTPAG